MKWLKKRRIEDRKKTMDELINMDEDDLKKIVKDIKNTKTKQKRHIVIRTIAEVLLFGTMGIFGMYSLAVDSIAYPRSGLFNMTLFMISFIFFLVRCCHSLFYGLFNLSYSKIGRQSRSVRFIENFFNIKNEDRLNSFLKLSGILYDIKKITPKGIEDKINKCSNSINGMNIEDEELTAKTLKIFMPLIVLHGTVDNVDEASANELVEKAHIGEQLDELNDEIIRKADELKRQSEEESVRRANEVHSMNQDVVTEISNSLEQRSREQEDREDTLSKSAETKRLNDIINKINESRNVMIERVSNQ